MKYKGNPEVSGKFKAPPHYTDGYNHDNHPPFFSFRHLRRNGDFCIDACNPDARAALLERLCRMSQLSWIELRTSQRHGMGPEKISRDAIRDGIPDVITPDVTILAFRLIGKSTMVGYRQGGTFFIVWLDPHFKLYPH